MFSSVYNNALNFQLKMKFKFHLHQKSMSEAGKIKIYLDISKIRPKLRTCVYSFLDLALENLYQENAVYIDLPLLRHLSWSTLNPCTDFETIWYRAFSWVGRKCRNEAFKKKEKKETIHFS